MVGVRREILAMKSWHYWLFFVLGLIAPLWVASHQSAPGYMDAEYYFAGGLRLAQGHGFTEMMIWNYLAEPELLAAAAGALPRPSHVYWMPLASLLAAGGMYLTKSLEFSAARLGFLLVMGGVPALTAALAWQLKRRSDQAWLAGILATLPGLYLPFVATTDVFGLQMVLGAAFFWLILLYRGQRSISTVLVAGGMGILAGLMHLARAEGLLWLGAAGLVVFSSRPAPGQRHIKQLIWLVMLALVAGCGYLLVTFPWYLRNLQVFHTLFAPGSSRALWLLEYNELFLFPGNQLTFSRWLAAGWGRLLQARGWAAALNLQTALAVQAQIFLAPLILVGAWQMRSSRVVRVAGLMWLAVFSLMTLVFPFQGARGGFFHAGAAFQPLFWALAPTGLDASLAWLARRRRWNPVRAQRVFRPGVVMLAALLTVIIAWTRLLSPSSGNSAVAAYQQVEAYLLQHGAAKNDIVMVNNPPGYFVASFTPQDGGRPAISIPYGDLDMVHQVANAYQARYLLLEFNQLTGDDDLYQQPGDRPGLRYHQQVAGVQIYLFEPVIQVQTP